MDVQVLKDLLNSSLEGPYPYIVLGIVAVMVFFEQLIVLSLLSPGSYAVVFASFLAFAGKIPVALMIVLIFVAAMAGTHVQYSLGKHRGSQILHWLNRYPRLVDLDRLHETRVNAGLLIVSYSLPQIRGIVPFLAGVSRMPARRWLASSAIGVAVWLTIFIGMGLGAAALFDGNLNEALDWVWRVNNNPWLGVLFWGSTILLVVYFIWRWRRPRPVRTAEITVPLESTEVAQ